MSIQQASKPKVLITGANGLLGQKLVEQLVQKGNFEVIATGRGPCRLKGKGFLYESLDIEQGQNVDEVIGKLSRKLSSMVLQ